MCGKTKGNALKVHSLSKYYFIVILVLLSKTQNMSYDVMFLFPFPAYCFMPS